MKEVFNEIFEKNKKIIRGREEEIKKYISKHYEETFITHELIKIERIDSTDHIKNVGFHKKLSSWRNTYKNIIVSSCLLDGGKQKRFDYKFHFTEEKLDAKLVEQIEANIEAASKLKRFAKFNEAYPIIDALIEQIKKKNDKFYNTRLLKIRTEISEAEKTFIKKSGDIKEYERKLNLSKETNNLKEALEFSNKIIILSKSIGSVQVLKKYTQESEQIKKDIDINKILKKITQFEERVEINRNDMKLDEAFKNCDEIINLAASIKSTNIQEKFNQIKEEIQQEIEKRDGLLAEISKLEIFFQDQRDKKEFDETLTTCDKLIELSHKIRKKDLENKFITLKSVILTEKKGIESILEEIEKLEQKMDEKQDIEEYEGALKVCNHILDLLRSIDRKHLEEKYNNIREQISKKKDVKRRLEAEVTLIKKKKDDVKKTRKERTTLKKQEQQELLMKVTEIENIIEIEEDTLPIVDEYSVQDLLGDLSDDIQETLQKVESLLDDHRVEIRSKILNSAVITSVTGEIVEINDTIEVQEDKKEDKTVNYSVQSGFENPFDDIIEEAILTDLIPYNFEITNVEMNGEKVNELPDKMLYKDGVEINWTLQNIQPRKRIEINYDLRRRISRTIIFLLGDQLKIIKTHFNVTKSEIEGFFDIKLPFTNSYNSKIKGVVIEDIIPLYYISLVKEPHQLLPCREQNSDMGELIKWNIGTMDPITMNYYYKLIDLFKFEQLKAIVSDLCGIGAQALNDRDISLSIEKYQEITSRLREYIK